MVLDVILIVGAFIVLLSASYQDLKMREVANWLSFGLIFFGLGTRLLFSFTEGISVLIAGIAGFLIFFLVAMFFHVTDQWGGGDSKLLMGMGAVIGFSLQNFSLLLFFAYLLVLGAVFGLVWSLTLAVTQRGLFLPAFKDTLGFYKRGHIMSVVGSFVLLGGSFFELSIIPFAVFPVLGFYLFSFMRSVEQSCFRKEVTPEDLVEGDWLADDIIYRKKVVMEKRCLAKKDVWKLIEWKHKNRMKTVTVKEGIPFIPAFLFAYIALVLLNDYIMAWFFGLL